MSKNGNTQSMDFDDSDDLVSALKDLDDLDAELLSGKGTSKAETETSRKNSIGSDAPNEDVNDFDVDDDLDDLFSDNDEGNDPPHKTEKPPKLPDQDSFSFSSSPKSNPPKGSPHRKASIKQVFTLDSSPEQSPVTERANKNFPLDDQKATKLNDSVDFPKSGKTTSGGSSIFANESDLPSPSKTDIKLKTHKNTIDLFKPEETKYLDDLGLSELDDSKIAASTKVIDRKQISPKKKKVTPKMDDIMFSDEDGDVLDNYGKASTSPGKANKNSFMDDLFANPKEKKKPPPRNIAAILEDKPQKSEKENEKDDDMADFSYALDSPMDKARRKSVKFEDQFQPSLLSSNDKTVPRRRQGTPQKKEGPFNMKTTSKKIDDDDDWLGLLKKTPKTESEKPSITSSKEKPEVKSEQSGLGRRKSSSADWLGLEESPKPSPKTSPKITTRQPFEGDKIVDNEPSNKKSSSRGEQLPWLSDTPSKRGSTPKEVPTPKKPPPKTPPPSAMITGDHQIPAEESHVEKAIVKTPSNNVSDIRTSQPATIPPASYAMIQNAVPYTPLSQMPSFIPPQSYAIPSAHMPPNGQVDLLALQTMLNSVQFERDQLLKTIEEMKKKQEEDLKMFQNTLENQKKSIEETFERKLKNIGSEHKSELKSIRRQLDILEEEKKRWLVDNQVKNEGVEKDYRQQMEKLKDLHNEAVSLMKRDHDEALNRLRKLKDREIEAITSTETHARSLRALTEQLEVRTSEIASLQAKVDEKHQMALEERQAVLSAKEKELKVWEGRLRWQTEDGEQERTRLQQLVLRMESRLQQQTMEGEEDRWAVQQRKVKLEVQQKYLEEEKKMHVDAVGKEKERLCTFQDSLLREQKHLLMQIAEERQQVMIDKKEVESLSRRIKDEESKFNIKKMKEESTLVSHKHMLEQEENKLRAEREAAHQESQQLYIERQTLEREKRQLKDEMDSSETTKMMLKRQSQEMEEMTIRAAADKEEAKNHLAIARKIESSHHARMNEFTRQMQALMEKEKDLMQDKEKLSDYKRELEGKKNSMLCSSCKIAVGLPMMELPSNVHQFQRNQLQSPNFIPAVPTIQAHSATIDPSLMVWYVTAQKDREYLQEQMSFLQSIKDFHKNGFK